MADGGVTGDYAGLARVRAQLEGVARGAFRRDLLGRLAETAADEVHRGFANERDPYGRAWPARQRRGDGHPLLRDYWALYVAAQQIRPARSGLRLTGPMPPYAAAHQYGHTYEAGWRENRYAADGRRILARSRRRPARIDVVRSAARTLPRRQFLPEEDTGGLGPIWSDALERAATRVFRAHFGL